MSNHKPDTQPARAATPRSMHAHCAHAAQLSLSRVAALAAAPVPVGRHQLPPPSQRPAEQHEFSKAIAMGNIDGARRALRNGADPNGDLGGGHRNPLGAAVHLGSPGLVRLLLRAGADPCAPDSQGRTPLFVAASAGRAEIVRALLARGAAVNASDRLGQTPLIAAARGCHAEVVGLLLRHGASPDWQCHNGDTALMLASDACDYESIHLLLKAGADIDLRDRAGRTALERASRRSRHTALATLVCFGCSEQCSVPVRRPVDRLLQTDTTTAEGQTALMLAARNGDLCIMDLLVRSGVQIDKQDARGETALMKAAYHGQVMAVDLLLARGADAALRSHAGETAIEMAMKGIEGGRHAQVIESLRAASAAGPAGDVPVSPSP